MPVARQLPSRLLHCGAKSARQAPTWTLSTPPGWGSCRRLLSLAALIWVGSMAGSPVSASSKGLLLCHGSLNSSGCRRTKTIKNGGPGLALLGRWCRFRACLGVFSFLNKSHGWACHSVSLLDGPDPVLELFGVWGLGPGREILRMEPFSQCSWPEAGSQIFWVRRPYVCWRLDAAANPAETVDTWASCIGWWPVSPATT